MIKRIKQLWEDNDTIEVCYPEQGSPVSVSATTLEKFAELIVRECADIAKGEPASFYDRDAYKLGRKFASEDVLKHFGVEE